MTNFSANFLTNCSFGEQFANLNELYIWYARTEQLCSRARHTVHALTYILMLRIRKKCVLYVLVSVHNANIQESIDCV